MERQFVEITFRQAGELFLFDASGFTLALEDRVVVETEHGQAIGTVKSVKDSGVSPPQNFQLLRVLRMASAEDLNRELRHQSKEKEAFEFCSQKIVEFSLPMKLIKAEFFFSGSKLLFYFSAEGRIDFRALVRDLARFFQKRIEMRQIGVRDSSKLIGGIGPCGQQLCCNRFLRQFNPVSIRMAKDQSLPLNPQKVSGVCGRLMCCLSYEQGLYQEMRKRLPRVGEDVKTTKGIGKVREVYPLQEKVRVVFLKHEPPTEEEILLKNLPDFRDLSLPEHIPVLTEHQSEKGARGKRRSRRGLEPLMESRHPIRNNGTARKPQRDDRGEESRRERAHRNTRDDRNPRNNRDERSVHSERPLHSEQNEERPQRKKKPHRPRRQQRTGREANEKHPVTPSESPTTPSHPVSQSNANLSRVSQPSANISEAKQVNTELSGSGQEAKKSSEQAPQKTRNKQRKNSERAAKRRAHKKKKKQIEANPSEKQPSEGRKKRKRRRRKKNNQPKTPPSSD